MPPSSVAPLAARKRKAAAAAAGGAGAAAGAGVAGGERAAKVARRPPSGGFVGDGHGLGGGIDTTGAPDGGYQLDADVSRRGRRWGLGAASWALVSAQRTAKHSTPQLWARYIHHTCCRPASLVHALS